MRKKLISLMVILCISVATTACGATFSGKVIDADTNEPIEGAVVVATWLEETTTLGATHTRLKDVKEILTDKKGKWSITGPRGREGGNITAIFTLITGTYYTKPPEFIVFKPGYCSWPAGFTIDACRGKLKPEGTDKIAEGENVELPMLTKKEDRWMAESVWPSLKDTEGDKNTLKKIKNFIRLKNEEARYLGLQEMYQEIVNEK